MRGIVIAGLLNHSGSESSTVNTLKQLPRLVTDYALANIMAVLNLLFPLKRILKIS